MRLWCTIVAVTAVGLLVPTAPGQDDGAPPRIENLQWFIMRSLTGDPAGDYTGVLEPFDPRLDIAQESDYIYVRATISDADWALTEEGNLDPDSDPVRVSLVAQWRYPAGYPAPEPPPVPGTFSEYRPEDGIGPNVIQQGRPLLLYDFEMLIPRFQGVSQARLRGLIDWDVSWLVVFGVESTDSTDEDPVRHRVGAMLYAIQHPGNRPTNPRPFADAGASQTIASGTTARLDGSRTFDSFNAGFDSGLPDVFEKDQLSYTWEWITGPTRVDPVYPDLVGTPQIALVRLDVPGVYVYRLLVDDGVNPGVSTQSVTVNVVAELPPDDAPKAIITGPAAPGRVGETITLSAGSSFDPQERPLTYSWRQTDERGNSLTAADVMRMYQPLSGTSTDTLTWQATQTGTFYFRLIVSNGSKSDTAAFTVVIEPGPPRTTAGLAITAPPADLTAAALDAAEDDTATEQTAAPLVPACGGALFPLAAVPLLGLLRWRRP